VFASTTVRVPTEYNGFSWMCPFPFRPKSCNVFRANDFAPRTALDRSTRGFKLHSKWISTNRSSTLHNIRSLHECEY
jgi:hypothetical protein